MKFLVLMTLLISTTVSAATYRCFGTRVNLKLDTNPKYTTLSIQDAQTGQTTFNGLVDHISVDGYRTKLIFTGYGSYAELQFQSYDFKTEASLLYGFYQGQTAGGFTNEQIRCGKL